MTQNGSDQLDPTNKSDSVRIFFMVLVLLLTIYALFSEKGDSLEYIADNSQCKQEAAAVIVYIIGLISTRYQYVYHRFVSRDDYVWHLIFWLFISGLSFFLQSTPSFYYANPFVSHDYFHEIGFYEKALWTLFLLTITLPPAIQQHKSDTGISGILLFIADIFALLSGLLFYTIPNINPVILFIGTVSFMLISFKISVRLLSWKLLKELAEIVLYHLSFWSNIAGLALFVSVFHRLFSGYC